MHFIGLVAVLVTLANAAIPSNTAYTKTPVSVSKCSITSTVAVSGGDVITEQPIQSNLNIGFVNTGSKPVRSITFDVAERGRVEQITDVGHFTSGARISQNFALGLVPDSRDAGCSVASVEYDDGMASM